MSRFPAPPEAMEEHAAIIGKTGAGKTYTAKGFAEDLLAEGARFCVIDPTGVWWGLKSSADGESEGFAVVVFGGDHGDVPLHEHDAEVVATIVATTATPCVIDVSAFPSLGAQKRFMADFAEHVFRMNREALHLFVDEADAFMPQRPGPDEMVMLGRWDTIARRGRSRGFRLTLITQRPAVLNKNALSQVGTLIALKLTSPQDRKAVGDWIEGNADKAEGKAVLASLPSLARGEGWVWSPGHDVLTRVQFNTITTWDSSRTPGKGEIHREAKTLARADISAILAKMGTPKAQQPGEVRTMPDADALRGAREAGHAAGLGEGIAASAEELSRLTATAIGVHGALTDMAATARKLADFAQSAAALIVESHPAVSLNIGARLDDAATDFMRVTLPAALERMGGDPGKIRAALGAMPILKPEDAGPVVAALKVDNAQRDLSPAARRMAFVLAERWPAGLTETQWGTLAKVKISGGAGQSALKMLREAAFMETEGDLRRATEECRAWVDSESGGGSMGGHESEFAMWKAAVTPTAARLLEELAVLGGSAPRATLAARAGLAPTGGSTFAALKMLHDNGVLTVSREGGVIHESSAVAKAEAERRKRNPS